MESQQMEYVQENWRSKNVEQHQPIKRKQIHSFGGMHINSLLYFFIPLIIFACLYCYHQAVKKKEEPPFPHATITATACHYSQDIVFRQILLPAGGFLNLIYFIAYRWLALLKKKTNYPGETYGYLYYLAEASILGYYGAIATIDEKGTPAIHGIGAVFFFIVLFVVTSSITLVLKGISEWDSSVLSHRSITVKLIISGYVFLVAIYFIVGALLQKDENGEDIYLVTIEWNLTIGCLIWLLTFVIDLKDIHLTFKGNINDTIKYIQ